MEGKGVCIYPEGDGTKFEGTFRHGSKEGRGTFTFNNGAVYEGHFRDDTLDGRSTGQCYNLWPLESCFLCTVLAPLVVMPCPRTLRTIPS